MRKIKFLLFYIMLLGTVGWGPFTFLNSFLHIPTNTQTKILMNDPQWTDREASIINALASNIDIDVAKLSLQAYVHAVHKGINKKPLLTIIDYSKPSTERRLWVVDLKQNRVLFNTWVTHGKNSGEINATSFSNRPGSLKSSIGVFLTEKPYMGGNGYSLRLNGLERGINDNAYRRDIVVHGAWYADPGIIKKYGQIGRSWGCPAVSPKTAASLINTIKDNSLVVVYYPDRNWLNHSSFLAAG